MSSKNEWSNGAMDSPENLSLYLFLSHQHTVQEQNGGRQFLYQLEEVHLVTLGTPSVSFSMEHLEP